MDLLTAKLVLTPLLIAVATLAARRWGPTVGGWVAGLPLTSGPVSVFLALEQGPSFAASAAQATLLGLIGVAAFCVGYARTANALNWPGSCALGLASYLMAVWGLSTASLKLHASILLVFFVLVAATAMAGYPTARVIRTRASLWDLPLRMVAATAMVLVITGGAERLGPTWSGLLSPFPVFAAVMAVFSHVTGGPRSAVRLLQGVVIGSFAFASFFVVVALMIESQSVPTTYSLAAIFALAVNGMSLIRILPTHRSNPLGDGKGNQATKEPDGTLDRE